jgi:Uma2 family endonuclease
MTRVAKFLDNWLDAQPEPRGQVLTGDAGVRLSRDPDTTVGADVLYVTADVLARQTAEITVLDGIPTLIVEILSPNTTVEELNEKIDAYLAAGVPLVWIIDPYRRTVTVHRPGDEPVLFNLRQDLTGDPHLPGFCVPVAQLFA